MTRRLRWSETIGLLAGGTVSLVVPLALMIHYFPVVRTSSSEPALAACVVNEFRQHGFTITSSQLTARVESITGERGASGPVEVKLQTGAPTEVSYQIHERPESSAVDAFIGSVSRNCDGKLPS